MKYTRDNPDTKSNRILRDSRRGSGDHIVVVNTVVRGQQRYM